MTVDSMKPEFQTFFYVCLVNFVVDMVTAASAPWPGVLCLFSLSCVSTLGFLPLKAEEGDD